MNHKPELTFTPFVQELQKECDYHANGGTSYRKRSADISLQVAKQVGEVVPFLNRDMAKQHVSNVFPNLDQDRANDVAKMLNVIARELHLQANLPDEIKQRLEHKRLNRKPLIFVNK